jgi:hypothetical protein
MTKTSYHIHISIRDVLMNWTDRWFKGVFRHYDGHPMTPREAKAGLMNELAKGREVLPVQGCDNFDFIKGCLGHPALEAAADDEEACDCERCATWEDV